MQPFDGIDRLETLTALDPAVDKVRDVVQQLLPPGRLRDALHGVWLGHPLHPVLVQVPIGSWSSAAILDCIPGTGPAAGVLIGTGLVTAVPAVAAGYADWSQLHPEQQRTGLVHAASNAVAIGLYAGSLLARLRGRGARGRMLGWLGITAASVGGLLGGHLAYHQAAGANHAEEVPHLVPADWESVGRLDELPDGRPVGAHLGEVPVFVLRQGDEVAVLADHCSHLSGPLHDGPVELVDGEQCIVCPWHGSTFRLRDGGVARGPATAPQPVFDVRVLDGAVEARLAGMG